jgi:hypothetical protein
VVSVISPIEASPPSGTTGGGYFLSVTIEVRTGAVVQLKQLFSKPSQALFVMAKSVKREALTEYGQSSFCYGNPGLGDLKSDRRSISNFALASNGLVVGSPGETICPWSVETVVPYSSVRPYLSPLGKWLVFGIRSPEVVAGRL